MKRRDFVKFAALLPVAPAIVAANQFAEPKSASSNGFLAESSVRTDSVRPRQGLLETAVEDAIDIGFTRPKMDIGSIDTQCSRINGFWTTFDDTEKQTNFLKGCLSKEDIWYNSSFKDFSTVHSVETIKFLGDGYVKEVTKIDFDFTWFCVWAGAKISINIVDLSIRIEQTSPTGTAFDWKLTRETYKDTVIRNAIELDAFKPKMLLSFAKAEKVPQTQIKNWMQTKKYSGWNC